MQDTVHEKEQPEKGMLFDRDTDCLLHFHIFIDDFGFRKRPCQAFFPVSALSLSSQPFLPGLVYTSIVVPAERQAGAGFSAAFFSFTAALFPRLRIQLSHSL
jgi:hypothetical protein